MADTRPDVTELIALGRDREAVAAATRHHDVGSTAPVRAGATNPGGTMDGAEQLDQIIPLLETVVAEITPDHLDAPTPCKAFTVEGVLEHMVAGATLFAPAFRGLPAPPAAGADAGDGDLFARWHAAMTDLLDAVHAPGADERIIAAPFGEVPGAAFARFVAFDGLVHGWDLATATGAPYAPAEELVQEVEAFAREALQPAMRDGDVFAEETSVPADVGALERLVAFSGRTLPT